MGGDWLDQHHLIHHILYNHFSSHLAFGVQAVVFLLVHQFEEPCLHDVSEPHFEVGFPGLVDSLSDLAEEHLVIELQPFICGVFHTPELAYGFVEVFIIGFESG